MVTTFLPNIIVSLWVLFRRSRAANSAVREWIWPKLELIQALMAVLLTCKNDEGPIKNESAKSGINIMHRFFRRSRADNSVVSSENWPKYELIQAFMHVLITCRGSTVT